MPIYEYRAENGQTVEEFHRMGRAPEVVTRTIGGIETQFRRQYGTGVAPQVRSGSGGVTYKGQDLPVSRTLPLVPKGVGTPVIRGGQRVRDLGDGTYCDMKGRRIVDTAEASKRHCAACGYTKDND